MSHSFTILFQAPNGIGLGHISRLMAIALAVRERRPEARLPFILEGGSHSLLEAFHLPYIALPGVQQLNDSLSWEQWSAPERSRIVRNIADSLLQTLEPRAVVFDTIPSKQVMAAVIRKGIPAVLCARKTKDTDTYFEQVQMFESCLNLILIPHEEGEVAVPANLYSRTRFVGQIVRPPRTDWAGVRNQTDSSPSLVVLGGGGGYKGTVEFYNCALEALARVRRKRPAASAILVAGPLFADWRSLRLVDNVRVLPFDPDVLATAASADLVICQAGYNTIAEISQLSVKTICVPAERVLDDQFERAEKAAAMRETFRVCRDARAVPLAELIDSLLDLPTQPQTAPKRSPGAGRAAEALLETIADRKAHAAPEAGR